MAEEGCLESPFAAARAAPGREVVEAFGVGEKDSEEDLGLNDGRPGLLAADSCDCRRAGEYGRLPVDAEATGPPWPAAPLSGHIFALSVHSRRRSASKRAPKRACLRAPGVAVAIAITAGVSVSVSVSAASSSSRRRPARPLVRPRAD
ncbi:hypothetical protein H106_03386 [Trichophyton rubrum CBS 735.88]|nr:hypothetical protein H106_03386 [Trichophyton rubrum CBS 735.88]